MIKPIVLQEYCQLDDILKNHHYISFNIDYQGNINILSLVEIPKYRTKDGCYVIPKAEKPHTFKIFFPLSDRAEVTIEDVWNYHSASLIDHNKVLLTCARTDNGGKNAKIYDSTGKIQKEFCFGEGIEDVQISEDGLIWCSYFDEGIFSEDKIGAPGLNCWNTLGEKKYSFTAEKGLGFMADCYALNVINANEVWFYYYTEFPLVRLKNKKEISYWKSPIAGAHAFSIYGNFILMAPGYHEEIFHLLKISSANEIKACIDYQLTDQEGKILKFEDYKARGEFFYFLSDRKIYRLDMRELKDIDRY